MSDDMQIAVICHTKMSKQFAMLRTMVSSAAESVLGH
jgi:hypothetical protein